MKLSMWIKRFKNRSFKHQLQVAFFGTMLLVLLLSVVMTLIWRRAYVQQIKESAYKDIAVISEKTADKLTAVENLSFRILDSTTIQTQLNEISQNDPENTRNLIVKKNRLSNEITDIIRNNSTIRNVYLFSPDNENLINFIATKEKVIENYTIQELINQLSDEPAKGQWTFAKDLSQGVYARKIFSTVDFSLKHIGTVIFIVDTAFFNREKQSLPVASQDSLFLLDYQDRLYSPEDDQELVSWYQQPQAAASIGGLFGTTRYQDIHYYYATDTRADEQLRFIYLLPENQVLADLYRLQWLFILVFLPLAILMVLGVRKISDQLTRPIRNLASQMREITETKQIESLKTLPLPEDPQEETAVLYNSYNTMIQEINQLITDNYEMRILSQEIEFKGLQAQLDPHFLYNTLDSINWLALANDQQQISEMVTSLAYLFRKKIDTKSEFTTLKDELDIVNAYIRIQKVRFGKRIDYIELVLVDDLSVEIPKLMIQPLIENVFKYAVNNMKTTCQLILSIELNDHDLVVNVSDNGPGFKSDFSIEKDGGIGLKNIQKRLQLHYGPAAQLTIVKSLPFKKTVVKFNIPLTPKS